MSTTALFVELLVIGLETLTWLALLVSSLFGLDWVQHLGTAFEKTGVFATVAVVGLAYLVGIIVDEICDSLIEPWAARIRSSVQEKDQPEMWDMQAYVFSHSEEATAQLGYMRSRLRILRSSIFNIALIGVFASVFLWTRAPLARSYKSSLTWFISVAGLVTVGLTLFVYWRITLSYWLRTRSVYKSLREQTSKIHNMSNPVKMSLAKSPKDKLLRVKETYLARIIPNIRRAYEKTNLVEESFILAHCAILSLSGFHAGTKNTNGATYRKFVVDFFPTQYDPMGLWKDLRNSLIHAYTLTSTYILSHRHAEMHFYQIKELRSERTGELADLIFLNFENFLLDLEQSARSYFARAETESDLLMKLCKRYDFAPPATYISDSEIPDHARVRTQR